MKTKWEYGQLMSGGGFQTFNDADYIEEIYPLADRLRAGMRFGGHVYRREIMVISDWEEIKEDQVPDKPSNIPPGTPPPAGTPNPKPASDPKPRGK